MTVPLRTDYKDKTKYLTPSIYISIRSESKNRYDRLPATDKETKALMNEIAQKVADAFRQ